MIFSKSESELLITILKKIEKTMYFNSEYDHFESDYTNFILEKEEKKEMDEILNKLLLKYL